MKKNQELINLYKNKNKKMNIKIITCIPKPHKVRNN